MEEKIGINIQEASEILGISKQLMAELTEYKIKLSKKKHTMLSNEEKKKIIEETLKDKEK